MTDIERRVAPYVERAEPRQRIMAQLRGLLSPAERKKSWQVAEVSGEVTPYGFQHRLRRALWHADAVRDELRADMMDHRRAPDAGLVIEETGFRKQGRPSAGVARQYSGTAGRIETCQIGVFLAQTSRHGQVLMDRELYRPEEWRTDKARCRQAGIPEPRGFATKPALAKQMLSRALAAGGLAQWGTGDRVYGENRRLRMWVEAQPHAQVLAVSGKAQVWLSGQQRQVKTLLAALPADGWARLSTGNGAKGLRWDDGRWLPVAEPLEPDWRRWLLVRRSVSEPPALQAYGVFAPQQTTRQEIVRVAGTRWTIESGFEEAKGEVGLEHSEVRSWTGWSRHLTLALWALALRSVLRAGIIAVEAVKKSPPSSQRSSSLAVFKASRGLRSP